MGLLGLIRNVILFHMVVLFFGTVWLQYKSFDLPVVDVKKVAMACKTSYFKYDLDPQKFRNDIAQKFPYILPVERFPPVLLSTGGLKGSVHLLYASLTEVLVIYHTPFRTYGETGRHFMNISVTVMQGEVSTWSSKTSTRSTHKPSDRYRYRIGEKYFVEMQEDSYILIHGRGLVPISIWYWVSDSLFSSFDPVSAILTTSYYMRAVYANWNISEYFNNLYDLLWSLASQAVSYVPLAYEYARDTMVDISNRMFKHEKQIMGDM